jgi:ArsR family metal-binding transcriptional regulator
MTLINNYKLQLFPPPCLPGSVYWSGKLEIDNNLTELLPFLNGYLNKRIYIPQAKTIVFNFENHKVSIRPDEIKIGNIIDKEEGEKVAANLVKFINNIWERRSEITPDYSKKEPPKVIDIYKLLPKTNCKKCNQPSCFVFATKLSQGDAEIYQCPEIDKEKINEIEKLFWG